MRSLLVLVVLIGAHTAMAQPLPDAGLPDASVGMGGADMGEEGDAEGSMCVDSSTCAAKLECINSRCVPKKIINAGCSFAGGGALALGALAALLRRRR